MTKIGSPMFHSEKKPNDQSLFHTCRPTEVRDATIGVPTQLQLCQFE